MLLAFSGPVYGEIVIIGSDKISINLPEGYCHLQNTNPSDSRLIQNFEAASKGRNKITILFASCKELHQLRAGELKNLTDFGMVASPLNVINHKFNMSREDYLTKMREILEENVSTYLELGTEHAKELIKKRSIKIAINETQYLGIVSQKTEGLYSGMMQRLQDENGNSKILVSIMGMSLINGKAVNFYRYKKYEGAKSLRELEPLTSTWVIDTVEDN